MDEGTGMKSQKTGHKILKSDRTQVIGLTAEEALRLIATRLVWDSSMVPVEERAMRIAQNLGWKV